jgi:hypothetical protein
MMSTEDNKATLRRWIEEGGNQGNVAVFAELSAPTGSTMILTSPTLAPSQTTNDLSLRPAAPSLTSIRRLKT